MDLLRMPFLVSFRVVDILQNWTFCIVDICKKTVFLQGLKLNG